VIASSGPGCPPIKRHAKLPGARLVRGRLTYRGAGDENKTQDEKAGKTIDGWHNANLLLPLGSEEEKTTRHIQIRYATSTVAVRSPPFVFRLFP